jgi:hypothetical protein
MYSTFECARHRLTKCFSAYNRAVSEPLKCSSLFWPTSADFWSTSAEDPDHFITAPTTLQPPDPPLPSAEISTSVTWSKNSAPARIANLRQKVSLWHVEWGPIHHWPQLFENGFGDAKEQGRSGQWAEEIQLVVENGRELLKEIQLIVDGMLPTEDWMMQDVW